MVEHNWKKTDRVDDGDEVWVCQRCEIEAPGCFPGQPPMTTGKSEVLPWNDCEDQLLSAVHDR
jgi:hypothetical protein